MLAHAEKDINYHDDIALEYDRTVVEPRIVTNDALYSKLLRFIPKGQEMLDLGCGTGHLSGRAGKRFNKVIAVDHSAGMLLEAKKKATAWGLTHAEFIEKNALVFVRDCESSRFDLVGCVGFLHHLQEQEIREILSQIFRILKPGGHAIFQEPIQIPAGSLPQRIQRWNSSSVVMGMKYCHSAPPPDEAPLKQDLFCQWLNNIGYSIRYTHRNWEIFPHTLPPNLRDKVCIRILNLLYGRHGNVYSVVARKAAP